MIIDMHTHVVPKNFKFKEGRASGDLWPQMDHTEPGQANLMISGKNFRTFRETAWDPAKRVEDLPNLGSDKQVLSPLPELLMYQLDAGDGAELATHMNDTIAGMVEEHPDRFYGLGTVPLQDIELAVTELKRIKQLGLLGVEIRTNINGRNLGDQSLRPFFREAVALDLAVFVHAYSPSFMNRIDYLPLGPLQGAVGLPIECGLAGASLIWEGVLEEFPDLRILMSHGGGVLTQLLSRSQDTHRKVQQAKDLLPHAPMDYARRMYYDDLAFSFPTLAYLIDQMGIGQITVGSDYSGGPARDPSVVEEFEALGLSTDEREQIGSRNVLRFLGTS